MGDSMDTDSMELCIVTDPELGALSFSDYITDSIASSSPMSALSGNLVPSLQGSPRRGSLDSLPPEVLVRTMLFLALPDLLNFTLTWRDANALFKSNFFTFIVDVYEQHPGTPMIKELQHIIHRILAFTTGSSRGLPLRPYEEELPAGIFLWHMYVRGFRERSQATRLPDIPRSVKCLRYLDRLLAAVDWFIEKFEASILQVSTEPMGADATLSREEGYRMRRGLLLFQLYCELFKQPISHRDCGMNGRVSEQMLFLQSMPLFLVGELDSIYSMVEDTVLDRWKFCCLQRVSRAFQPGRVELPSKAGLEYLYSHGLVFLHKKMTNNLALSLSALCPCCCIPEVPNRFFNDAMGSFIRVDYVPSQSYIIKERSNLTPEAYVDWPGAPSDTNQGSFTWNLFHNRDSRDRAAILQLIEVDQQNNRGLVFWDGSRTEKVYTFLQSHPDRARSFRRPCSLRAHQIFRAWAIIPYVPKTRPVSTSDLRLPTSPVRPGPSLELR